MIPQHHYVNSPLSISGSVLRSLNIVRNSPAHVALRVLAVLPLLVYVAFAIVWTIGMGLFLFPLRLLRRGSRARKVEARQHAELLAALNDKGNK